MGGYLDIYSEKRNTLKVTQNNLIVSESSDKIDRKILWIYSDSLLFLSGLQPLLTMLSRNLVYFKIILMALKIILYGSQFQNNKPTKHMKFI